MNSSSTPPTYPALNANPYALANLDASALFLETNKKVIATLQEFVTTQIDRLAGNEEKNNESKEKADDKKKKKKLDQAVQDKIDLYNMQLNCLKGLDKDVDQQAKLTTIIKEIAIISHHKRRSKWDRLANVLTLSITHSEATSWTAWKQLSNKIDVKNPFFAVYTLTLKDKTFRTKFFQTMATGPETEANNYNKYREKVLNRPGR